VRLGHAHAHTLQRLAASLSNRAFLSKPPPSSILSPYDARLGLAPASILGRPPSLLRAADITPTSVASKSSPRSAPARVTPISGLTQVFFYPPPLFPGFSVFFFFFHFFPCVVRVLFTGNTKVKRFVTPNPYNIGSRQPNHHNEREQNVEKTCVRG